MHDQMELKSNIYFKDNPKLFMQLRWLIQQNHIHWTQMLLSKKVEHSDELLKWIVDIIPDDAKCLLLKIQCYWILNGLLEAPKCLNCGKALSQKSFKNFAYGYHENCSTRCAKDSKLRKLRYAENFKLKYGVANPSQLEDIKSKKRLTSIQKLGVDNPAKANEVKAKIEAAIEKKYSKKQVFAVEDVIQKSIETRKRKYGVPWYSMTDEYHEKTKKTNLAKFGVEYPNQDPEIRTKAQHRYIYDNVNFDSLPELSLYIWLRDNQKSFEYQPNISFEYEFNGKTFHYQPDFLIEGKLYEIKGLQFFKDKDPSKEMVNPYDHSQDALYEAKHQCMLKNDVKILTENDYKMYSDYVQERHGKNYLKQFKKKM